MTGVCAFSYQSGRHNSEALGISAKDYTELRIKRMACRFIRCFLNSL